MKTPIVYLDILTTHNDLSGKNNCPIEVYFKVITEDELLRKTGTAEIRTKTIRIIPDEHIMPYGYIISGVNDRITHSNEWGGKPIASGMKEVYDALSYFVKSGAYIIGYNHISYDLKILNEHFSRILDLEPMEIDPDRIIDVLKLAKMTIPVVDIGEYRLESIYMYMMGLLDRGEKDEDFELPSSTLTKDQVMMTDNVLYRIIEKYFTNSDDPLKDIVRFMKTPRVLEYVPGGKFKGISFESMLKDNPEHIEWMRKRKPYKDDPDMIETFKHLDEISAKNGNWRVNAVEGCTEG